ncbi:MAG TPA: NADH-quinone oxidoreductase subunit A [Acidimicrobiales bacterium]|nr:NADH-quinone oxidoreductase subunit A [Acidimicrobiales bacterium]
MGSLDSYLPIFLLILVGIAFASLSFVASKLLAPQRPTAAKEAPYECGIEPAREPANRFPVRFYLIAMIFIVFDIEVIFLFPWAVVENQLGRFGLVEIIVFAAAVFISFIYLISNSALDWGPVKRVRPMTSDAIRTTGSTVRRVPPPGGPGRTGGAAPAVTGGEEVEAPAASSGGEAA